MDSQAAKTGGRRNSRAGASFVLGILAWLVPVAVSGLLWGGAKHMSETTSDSWGLEFAVAGIGILGMLVVGFVLALVAFLLGRQGVRKQARRADRIYATAGRVLALTAALSYAGFVGIAFLPGAFHFHYEEAVPNQEHREQVLQERTKETSEALPEALRVTNEALATCTELEADARTALRSGDPAAISAFQQRYVENYRPRLMDEIERLRPLKKKCEPVRDSTTHDTGEIYHVPPVAGALDCVQSVLSTSYTVSPENSSSGREKYYENYLLSLHDEIIRLTQYAQALEKLRQ